MLAQRAIGRVAEARQETGERERGFGNGERRTHLIILFQFLEGFDAFHCPEVDRAADDNRLGGGFDIDLQRRLPVEFDGKVDHVAAAHEAVRRRVGPAARHVDAHGTACPYDLVGISGVHGVALATQGIGSQSLAQEAERLIACGVFPFLSCKTQGL